MDDSFAAYACDQLAHALPVRSRRMFGGVGIWSGDAFFAIVADDVLYFKVDASNQADYEARGMQRFHPWGDERSLSYFEVPPGVLEDVDELRVWAAKALAVARG